MKRLSYFIFFIILINVAFAMYLRGSEDDESLKTTLDKMMESNQNENSLRPDEDKMFRLKGIISSLVMTILILIDRKTR
jgi:hypothetical protein